jgi:hypothetical protein
MSDDFGTVNLRRGDRAREIEVLRGHYRRHREALVAMIDDAPTESLALQYQNIIAELDRSLSKLNELESGPLPPAAPRPPEAPPRHPARTGAEPPPMAPAIAPTTAGMRPLAGSTDDDVYDEGTYLPDTPAAREVPRSRLALIGVVALLALAAIAWLIWRASSDRRAPEGAVIEEPLTTADAGTVAPEPLAPPSLLLATPESHDYGVVRKGNRAVRQFEIANNSEEPVSIEVARSACRCLYYEHAPVIPPKAKETLTVTVDGAKAKSGELQESLKISAKSDPTVATTVDVTATIQ